MKSISVVSVLAFVVATTVGGGRVVAFSPAGARRTQLPRPVLPRPTTMPKPYVSLQDCSYRSSVNALCLSKADDVSASDISSSRPTKSVIVKSLAVLSLMAIVWKREAILAFLGYVKNEWLLTTLDRLSAAGPTGLVIYTIVFMLWEMTFGITTPVETAAGMAFGAVPGIIASGTGKFLGALFSFLLARYAFSEQVQKKMERNELLALMEESVQETPFRVALLCRFSPLPEIVKNAGMGVLPVSKRAYMASLIVHGLSFTCLWTCMGAETGRVLRGLPPSSTLKILVTGATWIGFGAPVMIGLWIKSLREKQMKRRESDEKMNS